MSHIGDNFQQLPMRAEAALARILASGSLKLTTMGCYQRALSLAMYVERRLLRGTPERRRCR
jgi:hypothetical protein